MYSIFFYSNLVLLFALCWCGLGRSRHTFTAEELAEIEARPPEAYLAKPPKVKNWNLKRAKELSLTGPKSQKGDQPDRLDDVLVSFTSPKGPRISTEFAMELTANEIKTKMFEIAGIYITPLSSKIFSISQFSKKKKKCCKRRRGREMRHYII